MMSPWEAPTYITRVWCAFELFTAVQSKDVEVTIQMPPRELISFQQHLMEVQDRVEVAIGGILGKLDVQKAEASVKEDLTRILQLIQEGIRFEKFNSVLAQHLKSWILSTCENVFWAAFYSNSMPVLQLALLATHCSITLTTLGSPDKSMKILAEMHQHMVSCGFAATENAAKLLTVLGASHSNLGQFHPALGCYDQAKRIYENLRDDFGVACADMSIGNIKVNLGDLDGAWAALMNARSLLERCGKLESFEGSTVLNVMGSVLYRKGDFNGASSVHCQASQISERIGDTYTQHNAAVLYNIGGLKRQLGDAGAGEQELARSRTIFATLGLPFPEA